MSRWVIIRDEDGLYVSAAGSRRSYTRAISSAAQFPTRADAQEDACGNEHVRNMDNLIGLDVGDPASGTKTLAAQEAQRAVLEAVLLAFKEQRDPIPDSDLDDEQPISLSVRLTLGDIRRLRRTAAYAFSKRTTGSPDAWR